jgi:hypothetical protein
MPPTWTWRRCVISTSNKRLSTVCHSTSLDGIALSEEQYRSASKPS